MIRYEDTKLLKLFVGGLPYETDDQTLRESCTILKHFPLIKFFSHHFSRGTFIQTNGTNRQINANEKTEGRMGRTERRLMCNLW